jgi:CubicO group peptidase (beta-lactamase class C family)
MKSWLWIALGAAMVGGALLCLTLPGCFKLSPSKAELEAVEFAPVQSDDGWQVSTPEAEGLDPMLVATMYYNAAKLETIHSLLVIKDGLLIAEDYFDVGAIDRTERLQSVTKSVTSALAGIAVQQGLLSSVDQKMLSFFPEIAPDVTDPRKSQITIGQLLQMRSGYPWEETDQKLWAGLLSGYYVPLIEDFPLTADPGTRFQYSNLSSNWLGIVVSRVTNMSMKAYAEGNLFGPLGIEPGEWGTDAEGHNNGCGDLFLKARDMAKFGQLYLRDGMWEDTEIIPGWWVRKSLGTYSDRAWDNVGSFRNIGYGYQWWSAQAGQHHVNFAWGHGGQLIVLVRDLNLVVVTTAEPFWLEHDGKSWRHEKRQLALVSDFVASLP